MSSIFLGRARDVLGVDLDIFIEGLRVESCESGAEKRDISQLLFPRGIIIIDGMSGLGIECLDEVSLVPTRLRKLGVIVFVEIENVHQRIARGLFLQSILFLLLDDFDSEKW